MSDWKFPDVRLGDDVLVASDPSHDSMVYAKVTRVINDERNQAVDAIAFLPTGTRHFIQCWHADDPRVESQRDRFNVASTGVFRLTQNEIDRKRLGDRLYAIECRLAALDAQMDAMVAAESVNYPDEPPKSLSDTNAARSRGRPRKIVPEPTASNVG